jgi:hypothetical protein
MGIADGIVKANPGQSNQQIIYAVTPYSTSSPAHEMYQKNLVALTSTVVIAMTLGAGVVNAEIPSRAPLTARFHLAPSIQFTADSLDHAHGAIAVHDGWVGLLETMNPTHIVLKNVSDLHHEGKYIVAADTLLGFVIECLDHQDYASLDSVAEQLTTSIHADLTLYNSRGVARITNFLALTVRHADDMPHRGDLKEAYRERVLSIAGADAAQRASTFL